MPTVAGQALGCKVNQYDNQALLGVFERAGYTRAHRPAGADVVVVSTCSVTNEADRKSRQTIRRLRQKNPDAVLVVAGCYAQTAPGEVAGIPGVDVVLGNRDKGRVVELVAGVRAGAVRDQRGPTAAVERIWDERAFDHLPLSVYGSHTRAVLKIQEGCTEFCTYCIIPFARGRVRSLPPQAVAEEAARLTANGYREIVLAGIHLGAYGRDLPGRPRLAEVVRRLGSMPGLARLRISSIEPMDVGGDLLEAMAASPNACPHLHLCLQSGSDAILRRMRRRYDTAHYRKLVARARELMPGFGLTTDVIVGFPGETADDFARTLAFVEEMAFQHVHVFPFSPRRGTPAAADPEQVPPGVAAEREAALIELVERLGRNAHRRLAGQRVRVLAEGMQPLSRAGDVGRPRPRSGTWMHGLATNYQRVYFRGGQERRNTFCDVDVHGGGADAAWGVLADTVS